MNNNKVTKQLVSQVIPISILLITIYTVLPYVKKGIPFLQVLENTTFWWSIAFLILLIFFISSHLFMANKNRDNMLTVSFYLLWNIVCIARGMIDAEIYWDWKALIINTMALMLPIVMFSATNKMIVQSILAFYIKYTLPLFLIFAMILRSDAFGFFLMPISLLILFFPALSRQQKILIIIFTIVVIFADVGARSNVIKFIIPILILLIYYVREIINIKLIEYLRISLFVMPLLFFVLGVTNVFNVFNMEDYIKGDFTSAGVNAKGEREQQNVIVDTRTFLYVEVLESSIHNNYWLLGRTPARGNDSETFGMIDGSLTGRNERITNEIGLANVFTWTGILGVILYSLIFYRASYLAVMKSKSIYIKILGVYVAFRWLFSWVEDVNKFSINYFMLMIAIGMCFSISFRKMNNNEFTVWVRSVFDVRYLRYFFYLGEKQKEKSKENVEKDEKEISNVEVKNI